MTTSHDDAHLEINDCEINRICGTDRVAAYLVKEANLEKNKNKRIKIYDSIVYLYSTADKVLMNDLVR
jgi:hypothetical protein